MSNTARGHVLAAIVPRHPDGTPCTHRVKSSGKPLEEGCGGRADYVSGCSCGWSESSVTKEALKYAREIHKEGAGREEPAAGGEGPAAGGAVLVDTDPVVYETPATKEKTVRPCRTWLLPDGCALSIVTEPPGAPGLSVTNAAVQLAQIMAATSPGESFRVIEHYPADGTGPERYAEQLVDGARVGWRHVRVEELRALLGDAFEEWGA